MGRRGGALDGDSAAISAIGGLDELTMMIS